METIEALRRMREVAVELAERRSAYVAMVNLVRRCLEQGNPRAAAIQEVMERHADMWESDRVVEADLAQLVDDLLQPMREEFGSEPIPDRDAATVAATIDRILGEPGRRPHLVREDATIEEIDAWFRRYQKRRGSV